MNVIEHLGNLGFGVYDVIIKRQKTILGNIFRIPKIILGILKIFKKS